VVDLFVVRVQEVSAAPSWVLRTHMPFFFVSYACLSLSSESVTSFIETKILFEPRLLRTLPAPSAMAIDFGCLEI
jgi:hypothetical protein